MTLWKWLTRTRPDHGWPGYIINGRIRTSTAALIVAFFAVTWLHNAYKPPPPAPTAPETQVVPPGFVPDPEYTWVPRTYVQPTRTSTTPTTTTETSPTTTEPSETSSTIAPTTVIDPDGPGPLPPQTITGPPTVSTTVTTSPTTGPATSPTTQASSPSPSPVPLAPPR